MRYGPEPEKKTKPTLGPRSRPPRLTLKHDLPAGVRRGRNMFGETYHEYRQAGDRWAICGGRRTCRECLKEDAMKSTMDRLREALTEHFGLARMKTVRVDEDLFGEVDESSVGRRLGDEQDRSDLLHCVEAEFGIDLPDCMTAGTTTLAGMRDLVDSVLASRNTSPH